MKRGWFQYSSRTARSRSAGGAGVVTSSERRALCAAGEARDISASDVISARLDTAASAPPHLSADNMRTRDRLAELQHVSEGTGPDRGRPGQ